MPGGLMVNRLLLALALAILLVTIPSQTTAQQGSADQLKHVMSVPLDAARAASLTALSIERSSRYPSVITLKGRVEIKTPVCLPVGNNGARVCDGEMIVHADEAEFHEDTGEIEARGSVKITPLRHRKD
jgi:hypothetical protein